MDELEGIVQRMIDAGEPEEVIAMVIRDYKPNLVPDEEEIVTETEVQEIEGGEIQEDNVNWDMVQKLAGSIEEKNAPSEQDGFPDPVSVEMESDNAISPQSQAVETIELAEESPLQSAQLAHEQDTYEDLSAGEKDIYEEGVDLIDYKEKATEVRELLEGVNDSDEEYEKELMFKALEFEDKDDINMGILTSQALEGLERMAKSPEERFNSMYEGDEKPSWVSQAKWEAGKSYLETGKVPQDIIKNVPDSYKNITKKKIQKRKLNNYFHATGMDEKARAQITALASDQMEGKLGYEDVMKFADNSNLLNLEVKKNNARADAIMKDMVAIEDSQLALDSDEEYIKINDRAEGISIQLQEMKDDGINPESPSADIKKYNNLLAQFEEVKLEYKTKGFQDKKLAQATMVENWNRKREELQSDANELGDVALALDLGSKNYSLLEKAKLNVEKAFMGDMVMGSIGTTAGILGDITAGKIRYSDEETMPNALSDFLHKVEGVAINYNESLAKGIAISIAPGIERDDVTIDNIGNYMGGVLAEGAPSIATILMSTKGGRAAGRIKSKGLTGDVAKAVRKKAEMGASKLAQAAFFGMGYGGKGMEIAIAQKNAPEAIELLRNDIEELDEEGKPMFSKLEVAQKKKEIEELNNTINYNVLQKAGSSLLAGGIDMYSEKIGSLGYMKNLSKLGATVDAGLFKKMMYQGLKSSINVGIELVEETAAAIGNNISDIYVLKEDKSIVDGIDAKFFDNVALTSLAIQGPSIGSNVYNMFSDEVKTKSEIKANKMAFKRLLQVEDALSSETSPQKIKELRKEKIGLMETAAFNNIVSVQKLAQMSTEEKTQLFEINRQRRKIINNLRDLGGRGEAGSKAIKNQKTKLVKEFNSLDAQRNELLSKKEKQNQESMKEAADPALAAYNLGLNEFWTDVVGVQQELNGNKLIRVDKESTVEDLQKQFSDETSKQVIEARDRGDNATFVGDDIIIFKDNIKNNLKSSKEKTAAMFAAVSPLHELQHIQNRKAGIVVDEVVVKEAEQAINEADVQVRQNFNQGKITQEQFNDYQKRKKQYTDKSTGKVDVEELLNLFGDMSSTGILSEGNFNKINGLKYVLKSMIRKFNIPQTQFLFPLKTGSDVFSYVKSFQNSVSKLDLKMAPPEENKDSDLKLSQGPSEKVQEIFEDQGEAGAFEIIEQFKPIVNKIVQRRSEAPGFDRQLLTDEIETGERGLLDLIRSYKQESGVPLAAYINKFLPSRAIEASRRILGEEFEDDIDDQKNLAAVEESDNEIVGKPKRAIKLKKRLTGEIDGAIKKVRSEIKNLPINQLDFKTLRNVALEEVQTLFGIKPKPGNLTKDDVRNAQQYINKNAESLITMLPEGATPSGTSTGIQKVLLDNFYKKTGRASMAKTGSKAGLSIYEKRNDITSAEFKEVFGITPAGQPNVSDRNTSARIKALVSQTERMLTNQEVREVLEEKGQNVPQALIEGKNNLMASQGPSTKLNSKQLKAIENTNKEFEEGKRKDQTLWNSIVKANGEDPINMTSIQGKKKAREVWFEGKENVPPILTFFTESFVLKNKGTFANGGMYQSVTDDNGKPIRLDNKEKLFLQSKDKTIKIDGVDKDRVNITIKDDESLKSFKLENGKTIRNNDPAFVTKEIQLQIMPGKRKDGKNNFMFANGLQVDNYLKRFKDNYDFLEEDNNINSAVKRSSYANLKKKFNTEKFTQEQKDKQKGFIDILSTLNNVVNSKRKEYLPAVAALLSATSGGQGHFIRKGSILGFNNTLDLKIVEEHVQPASDFAKFIFNRMAQGSFDLYVNKSVDAFFQGALPRVYDQMLKGVGFNYTNNVPKKYRLDVLLGKMPVWVRYFNPQVNEQIRVDKATGLSYTGIDPNVIVLANGKTVAEEYGVPVIASKRTPDAIAKQQELLFEIFTNPNMTKEIAASRLKEYLNITPSKLKASKGTIKELSDSQVLYVNENMTTQDLLDKAAVIDKALKQARKLKAPIKKIRVFDFDDTLATSNSLVFYTKENGEEGELTAEEFADKGSQLVEEGAVMDFTDFNIVRDGKRGPMFDIAQKIKEARGTEDIFILTARAPQAQEAIYEFLKDEGLEIPIKNIVGLGNSTAQAKANFMLDKAAEGYNDFYFSDDVMKNIKEVKKVLDVVDVKSKVQQAKLKFSKGLNGEFNSILEKESGISADKEISAARAKTIGSSKGNFKFFIPYSAEDFMGLIYPTLSKGSLGDAQMAWYKQHLMNPFARGMSNLRSARIQLMDDFRGLKKSLQVPKNLSKTNGTGFTNDQSIRVYLYNKMGYDIPGMSKEDVDDMVSLVEGDSKFFTFAEELSKITKGDPWIKPGADWLSGTITTDLIQLIDTTKRENYLFEFQQNVDAIYSEKNLNKLEAMYGPKYREALENMLARMKSGKNRSGAGSRLGVKVLDYINGSNAAIMFFNTRSAVLQTISSINFVNWSFNNPYKAGKAFANQPQYWSDFMKLMNSEYLRDRRNGLRINVSESEIAEAAKTSKNKAKGVLSYILEKGYAPTQYADSFAIASGGATFFRNRINDLVDNQKMTQEQAEKKAMEEFIEVSEESQQSSRPDKISQQQSSDVGRLILMFANTPMQYARLQKRAAQDLINGRGDWKSHISKIAYYGFVQNLMFNALQQAVFAMGFDGDDDEEADAKKAYRTMNGMSDSMLRGLGIGGAAVSVVKNLLLDIYERSKRSRPEYTDAVWKLLQFSPPISSKISKLRAAGWQFDSKDRRQEMLDKGFSIENPAYLAGAKVVSATTNIPLDRVLNKYNNVSDAVEEETEWWQSVAMLLGWPKWQLEQQEYEKKSTKKKKKTSSRKVYKRKTYKRKK